MPEPTQKEIRVLPIDDHEIRIEPAKDDKPTRLTGYAARFNRPSVDLGGFIETIKPGAFKSALESSDVRALVNHDPNQLLGRAKAGTLRLTENAEGLRFEVDLPDTQLGRDIATSISRGDMSGCSFAFTVGKDSWEEPEDRNDPYKREIHEVRELFDVGPVTYPAYPDTTVAARSLNGLRSPKTDQPNPVADKPKSDDRADAAVTTTVSQPRSNLMATTVIQLRQMADAELAEARKIKDKADAEGRLLIDDENKKINEYTAKAENLRAQADTQEKLEKLEMARNTSPGPKVEPAIKITNEPLKLYRASQLRAFKGNEADRNAYTAGKWLLATVMGNADARQWCRDHGVELRVMTEGVNSAGGYLVPTQMERAIIDLRDTYGMFRANARVVPMTSDNMVIPRRAGGVTAYFVGETSEITASDKSWNNVELVAKKLGALCRMSTDLSEDAIINLADDLAQEMAWAFAKKEDECGIDGDGTSTYGGIVGIRTKSVDGAHAGSYYEAAATVDTFAEITSADLTGVMGQLPKYAHANAKWYCSQLAYGLVFQRLMAAGGGNSIADLSNGATPRYMGYPIVISPAMPAVATSLDAVVMLTFGDLRLSSTLGDRRGITLKTSTERYLEYDQIGIQATERFTINNHDIGGAAGVYGPIVNLIGNIA